MGSDKEEMEGFRFWKTGEWSSASSLLDARCVFLAVLTDIGLAFLQATGRTPFGENLTTSGESSPDNERGKFCPRLIRLASLPSVLSTSSTLTDSVK